MEDPAKKRREYLRRKARLYGVAVLTFGTVLICYISTLIAIPYLCAEWMAGVNLKLLIMSLAVVTPILVVAAYACDIYLRAAKSVPHVPPAHEQIATLPAEEVLLRGSDQPTAESGELLRAAHDGDASPAEELLRADT